MALVVLGWLGANRQAVIKYSNIVQCSNQHIVHNRWNTNIPRRIVQQDNILVIALSIKGTITLSNIIQQLPLERTKIVIDSAPCIITPQLVAKGVTGAIAANLPKSIRAQDIYQQPGIFEICSAAVNACAKLQIGKEWIERANQAIENLPGNVPYLFMYSKADKLIPHQQVAEFAQRLSKRAHVEEFVFDDSPHVGHFKMHPQEYQARVLEFWKS